MKYKITVLCGLMALAVGCGQVKTASNSLEGADSVENVPDITEISSKMVALDSDAKNIEKEILSMDTQNPLSLFGDDLKDSVKKFSGVFIDVKSKISELKIKINDQISKLDRNDSRQQKLIEKLEDLLAYLDKVESQIDELVAKIESKIDTLFAKLERKLEERLSGLEEMLAKLALDKLKDSVLKNLIGG